MFLNIILGASLCAICLGELSNAAVSSMSFHREDIPYPDEYDSVHFYDKVNSKKNLNDYQLLSSLKTYSNMQYAPLDLSPNEQENLQTLDMSTTKPTRSEVTDRPEPEVITKRNILEPQSVKQHTDNRNAQAILQQHIDGHNIKIAPKANKILYKNELNPGYHNHFAFPDGNKLLNIRSNIQQSYPNIIYGQRQEVTPFLRYSAVTETNRPQKPYNLVEQYHERPIKLQILSALENANIQPIFNSYYVKAPRLHLNIARAYKIANDQYKAPGSKRLTFLINKPK